MSAEALTGAESRIADAIAQHSHAPCVAIGIIRDGVLVRASSPSTRFRIASMTKSFVAASVLLLRDERRLSIDDEVGAAVPSFASSLPSGTTLRRLLTMTSGLATDDPWADRLMGAPDSLVDEVLAGGVSLAVEPASQFEYSNLGYVILGRVVSVVAGLPLQEFVRQRLLTPLAMTSTGWDVPGDDVAWARPHRAVDGEPVADDPPVGDGSFAPLGGLWSTVEELAKWVAMLSGDGAGPLSVVSRREMSTAAVALNAEWADAGAYGMGLDVIEDPAAGTVVGHSGGVPGYGSHMRWQPGGAHGVIALANVTYAPMESLARLLLQHEVFVDETLSGSDGPIIGAAHRLVALLNNWSDVDAHELFTSNVGLDDPFSRRAAAALALTTAHGVLDLVAMEPAHRMRAHVTLLGRTSGRLVRLSLNCAPPLPVRVQQYRVEDWS